MTTFLTPQGHIESFLETTDMTIAELREVVHALLRGEVLGVQEKLDGQNLTFTVRDGKVETFSKGVSWARVKLGGKTKSDIDNVYAARANVRDAFALAHDSLQEIFDSFPEVGRKLFQNGDVVVNAELVLTQHPNIIPYEKSYIFLMQPFAMNPSLEGKYDEEAFKKFVLLASSFKSKIPVRQVPGMLLGVSSEIDVKNFDAALEDVLIESGASSDGTVGDILSGLVKNSLVRSGLQEDIAKRLANRLAKKDKRSFSQNDAKAINPSFWSYVKSLDESRIVDETRVPFEKIIIDVARVVFRNTQFQIAPNTLESSAGLQTFVKNVRKAYNQKSISGSADNIDAVRVCLLRIGDEKRFEKAVEGIVFQWRGKLLKLTGLFSSINKLRGLFYYGNSPVKISSF
jgi:hypothetical protein